MRVVTRKTYGHMERALESVSYQWEFPKKLSCDCGDDMLPMVALQDEEGLISENRPKGAKVWPHDCVGLVVYICTNCGKAKVEWNQA